MKLTRQQVLAGSIAALATTRPAGAQASLTTVRVASNPVNDVVGLLYAQQSGLFRNAGLDVTLQKATSGSAVAAALAGKAIEIGKLSATTLISAHARGVPFVVIFPNRLHSFGAQTETALIVAPNSPIRGGRDLNGKTVAVSAVKDSTWVGARFFIDAAGGDSTTVKFVEIPFSAAAAAVVAGRVDAAVSNDPYLKEAVRAGQVRPLGDLLGGLGSRFIETAWCTTREYVAGNRETVQRFARAIRDAQIWCNAHHTEAAEMIATFTGIDKATVEASQTLFATEMDPRDLQPYVNADAKYGLIPSAFDAAELYLRA